MPPQPQFYDSTDTTQQTAVIAVSQDAGTTYGPTEYHAWNDKGGTLNGTLLKNARIRPVVYNGTHRVESGYPVLDEKWVQIAVVGKNNTGDSTMEDQTTGFAPVGAGAPLVLKDIPKNCARHIQVKIVVPAGAQNLTQQIYLELIYDEASIALPLRMGAMVGPGVLADWIDAGARRITRGRSLTAAGTDVVTVTAGSFVYDAAPKTVIRTLVTLNQTANDGALTTGQSYKARLSQKSDGTVTTTKSNRGASPTAPNVPANEIDLGVVAVVFQSGGTSIINTADLDTSTVLYGEYFVWAGTGLAVKIGGGAAFSTLDTETFSGSISTISATDNATNRIWLHKDGTFSKTTTATSPETGAQLLAEVVTSAGAITSVTNKQQRIGRAITEWPVILTWYGPPVTNEQSSMFVLPFDANLDSVDLEVGQLGTGGTSGNFKIDVLYWSPGVSTSGAGTTIYTSSGTQDLRPTVAYNASSLRAEANRDHEVIAFSKGTRFAVKVAEIPAGTFTVDPQDVFAVLHFLKK